LFGDRRKNYDPASNDPSSDARGGYALLDFFATWAPGGRLRGLRVDAGIGNVTDKNYAPYQTGVSAPGRNFKVVASYTLGHDRSRFAHAD
jgi:outer membrane receptor protein involved in Fe transport